MEFTFEMQELARKAAVGEVGTESACPRCGVARVKRSDYIRCNPCATNWNNGEDTSKDPRAERTAKFIASVPAKSGGSK